MTFTTSSHLEPGRCATPRMLRVRRRVGFTLIELLVVVAIIAVLVALTGAAVQMTMTRQRNLNTKSDVNKIQQALDLEYDRVVKKCMDDRNKNLIPQGVVNYCDGDQNRAQAVWTAMNLRRQFPESFTEANSAIPLVDSTGTTVYAMGSMATFAPVATVNSNGNANEESGALLFIILTQKSVAGGGALVSGSDDLNLQKVITFSTSTGTGASLPTFKDSWGNSIGFHRWYGAHPADLSAVQAAPYLGSTNQFNPGNHDPLDTRSLVLNWSNAGKRGQMQSVLWFNGLNRLATVYSLGQTNVTPAAPVYGFQVKQYGN